MPVDNHSPPGRNPRDASLVLVHCNDLLKDLPGCATHVNHKKRTNVPEELERTTTDVGPSKQRSSSTVRKLTNATSIMNREKTPIMSTTHSYHCPFWRQPQPERGELWPFCCGLLQLLCDCPQSRRLSEMSRKCRSPITNNQPHTTARRARTRLFLLAFSFISPGRARSKNSKRRNAGSAEEEAERSKRRGEGQPGQ